MRCIEILKMCLLQAFRNWLTLTWDVLKLGLDKSYTKPTVD